jgi:hypothetical protein
MSEPVAWIESPHGAIRRNPAFRLTGPQSLSWSLPLYLHSQPCPYIRNSAEGTHWCALAAQPPDHREVTDEMVQRAAASLREALEPYAQPTDDEVRDALRAALGETK